jgi:hypothetical protein
LTGFTKHVSTNKPAFFLTIYFLSLAVFSFFIIPIPWKSEGLAEILLIILPAAVSCITTFVDEQYKSSILRMTFCAFVAALSSIIIMYSNYGQYMPNGYYIAGILGAEGERADDARIAEMMYKWWALFYLVYFIIFKIWHMSKVSV